MRRYLTLMIGVVVIVLVIGIGVTQLQGKTEAANSYSSDVIAALSGGDTAGFARALTVRDFNFPQDYGAHPDFQTEWWYYTGNLATADGRRFGYELTIFRRALTPTQPERTSAWATNQLYFADFALTDVQGSQFYSTERFSRGAAGLAGAQIDPKVRIWIENWSMEAQNTDATVMRLRSNNQTGSIPITLDLTTTQTKPPALEGDRGLSAKSSAAGNASYYYSLTRLDTSGTFTIGGTPFTVSGASWMDHEFSTSVLSVDAIGWDWFSLQLSDKREVMLYRIRLKDGTTEPVSDGTLINADGSTEHLTLSDYTIDSLATWHSPSGATYPSRWHVTIHPKSGVPIILEITPLLADQELRSTNVYWEGASQISGSQGSSALSGYGYVELTGYNPPSAVPTPGTLNQQPH